MTTISITIYAQPKTENDHECGDYRIRRVSISVGDDDSAIDEMCDPDAGWDTLDQWVSSRHIDQLRGAGLSYQQIADVMRQAWDATSYVHETVTVD